MEKSSWQAHLGSQRTLYDQFSNEFLDRFYIDCQAYPRLADHAQDAGAVSTQSDTTTADGVTLTRYRGLCYKTEISLLSLPVYFVTILPLLPPFLSPPYPIPCVTAVSVS